MPKTSETSLTLPAEYDIGLAGAAEAAQVCQIIGSAFTHDPVLNWIVGQPRNMSVGFRAELEAIYKHHNLVFINREQTGAAMWLPPGISTKAPFHWRHIPALLQLLLAGGVTCLKRIEVMEKLSADNKPDEPHFYLHSIGASQGNQGRGIGSALLKAGLKLCDQQHMPAYLESSNKQNIPLYECFGFEIVGEDALPDGGPNVWFMARAAR